MSTPETAAENAAENAAEDTGTPPTQSYEQAREELADVVRQLEGGGLTLEESLALWERGEELAGVCQHWLDAARERLAKASPQDS